MRRGALASSRVLFKTEPRPGYDKDGVPVEGNYSHVKPLELDPASIQGRLKARAEGATNLLSKVPALREDLTDVEKVRVQYRQKIGSTVQLPVGMLENKDMKRALRLATRQLEAEERWAILQEDQKKTDKLKEKLSTKTVAQVLARAGYAARHDMAPFLKGKVTVNGRLVREPNFRVLPHDDIQYADHQVLVDYPRIWRMKKAEKDYSFATSKIDPTSHYERLQLKGLPNFAYSAGGVLPAKASGLMLWTNDPGLATYLDRSPDVEKDWIVQVNGQVHVNLIKSLNSKVIFEEKEYVDMEWVLKSVVMAGKIYKKLSERNIVSTYLEARAWGPSPHMVRLMKDCNKNVVSLKRNKIGPYNDEVLMPGTVAEAYIDEGLMAHCDHTWMPWVDKHEPLLQQGVTSRIQRHVNLRRTGAMGAEQLADDLEVFIAMCHDAPTHPPTHRNCERTLARRRSRTAAGHSRTGRRR